MTGYDVMVVRSGFGGSVAALRLTEKGYRVGVLEAGRRFTGEPDPRPARGYPRLEPVPPRRPPVPPHAPAALRLRPMRVVRDDAQASGTDTRPD